MRSALLLLQYALLSVSSLSVSRAPRKCHVAEKGKMEGGGGRGEDGKIIDKLVTSQEAEMSPLILQLVEGPLVALQGPGHINIDMLL